MAELLRRRFLTVGATTVGVAAAGAAAGFALGHDEAPASANTATGSEPFYGQHQAGVATAQQDRLLFASFDLTSSKRGEVVDLLRSWTEAAARMTAGHDSADAAPTGDSPPADTGEATGLDPAHLTLTFGFGPGMFEKDGVDRYGLKSQRPEALVDLPRFAGDQLDRGRSGGDVCVQACSHDPQVAYHAIRNLTRIARGRAVLRWTQQGFGRTSATTPEQLTPRNLMGFKDGTNNVRAGVAPFDDSVWVRGTDGPAWMTDGSYLVARRIRIFIEVWDRSPLNDQEATIGRNKVEGAPLGGAKERDVIDLELKDDKGEPVIALDAHVRLASQDKNAIHILRRGYSFTDGTDPRTGQLDAGLFFLAYMRDPRTQFIPLQQEAATDALNEYIQHVGSAIYAVPGGVAGSGSFVGSSLFG